MNQTKSPLHKVRFKNVWWIGALGLLTISMLDLSSYCHPSVEAERTSTAVKAASMMPTNRISEADFESTEELTEESAELMPTNEESSSIDEATAPTGEVIDGYSELTWKTLEDVEFKDVYIEELDAYYWKPTFGSTVNNLESESVYITGYVIPVDLDEDFYVLSRYPFANCFFCGGAGPESVIDLRFDGKSPRVYQTDERLTFAGKFRLNADDIYQMNYILDGAKEFKP